MHFQTFLLQKLRTSVVLSPQHLPFYHKHSHTRTHIVDSLFEPTCVMEIKELIMKSPSKSCELDPVPTSLIKQNIDVFAKYITIIVNRSLSSGCFPDSQKVAHVKPLLKKPNLDKEVFKNYRPVANLKYLGKTIERVVSSRISDHVRANNLSDTFQSAYKPFHGTETALLRINNDILSAIGINDIALDWCKSYLLNRPQHVCIGNAVSKPVILDYSVPQGSVLGPQWFTVYTGPVRDIILKYILNYHVYADVTQLYITFKSSKEPADSCITTLEKCIQEIRSWVRQNFLKLNDEKTEFLLFGSRQQLSKVCLPFITIGDSQITSSSQARNLGVIFDSTMTLKPYISNIVHVSSFHIQNISRIRKYLNQSAAEQIIHAFVTSRLDNGNALLYRIKYLVFSTYKTQQLVL